MGLFKREKPYKSYWWRRHREIWSFYCPLCRSHRKVPFRPNPGGLYQWLQVGLTSAFFALVFWKSLAWKGFVSIVPFWTLFEIFYRWRKRAVLGCPHCGFDPYLFGTDLKRARDEVESHWRKKFAEKGIPYPKDSSGADGPPPPGKG